MSLNVTPEDIVIDSDAEDQLQSGALRERFLHDRSGGGLGFITLIIRDLNITRFSCRAKNEDEPEGSDADESEGSGNRDEDKGEEDSDDGDSDEYIYEEDSDEEDSDEEENNADPEAHTNTEDSDQNTVGALRGCKSLLHVDLRGCPNLTSVCDDSFRKCSNLI